MSVALIDDQLLSAVLRDQPSQALGGHQLYTTGYWYVRLCQAVLGRGAVRGILSGPFGDLPASARQRAFATLLELPESIGLVSMRELGPEIGRLRGHHALNVLSSEALAAAVYLQAEVHLSAPSPKLEDALDQEGIEVVRRS
jgi:hypothetical protein